MAALSKRARVEAACARAAVDRPPVAFWRHVPDVDHTADGLAEAMLTFHRRWDLDLIKVMSSGVYCVEDWGCRVAYQGAVSGAKQCTEHAIKATEDWGRLRRLDPGAGALARELEAVRRIARGRADDAPVLHTVFSPLTIARKLAGDQVDADMRAHPGVLLGALEVISSTVERYCRAALEAGADGLFFATQCASAEVLTEGAYLRFEEPFLRRLLGGLQDTLVLLHVHGKDIYFDRLAALPARALNWHDRLTAPSLGEGGRRARGAVVGGLAENTTLRRGTPAAVAAEVRDAVEQTGGRGLMVGAGCVVPLDVPDASLAAVVDTVRALEA